MKKLKYLLLLFIIPIATSCESILSSNDQEEENPQVVKPLPIEMQAGTGESDDEPIAPPPPLDY